MALMRSHQGSISRQSILSEALVKSLGSGGSSSTGTGSVASTASSWFTTSSSVESPAGGGGKRKGQNIEDGQGNSGKGDKKRPCFTPAFGGDKCPAPSVSRMKDSTISAAGRGEGEARRRPREPLVADAWFQLVLCRECMVHGFQRAAEVGLRRLREGAREGVMRAMGDSAWAWTEVLMKVSTSEAFYADSTDQVCVCAAAGSRSV